MDKHAVTTHRGASACILTPSMMRNGDSNRLNGVRERRRRPNDLRLLREGLPHPSGGDYGLVRARTRGAERSVESDAELALRLRADHLGTARNSLRSSSPDCSGGDGGYTGGGGGRFYVGGGGGGREALPSASHEPMANTHSDEPPCSSFTANASQHEKSLRRDAGPCFACGAHRHIAGSNMSHDVWLDGRRTSEACCRRPGARSGPAPHHSDRRARCHMVAYAAAAPC